MFYLLLTKHRIKKKLILTYQIKNEIVKQVLVVVLLFKLFLSSVINLYFHAQGRKMLSGEKYRVFIL